MHEAGGSLTPDAGRHIDDSGSVMAWFRAACRRVGGEIAIAHHGPSAAGVRLIEQLTYADLARRAEAVARRLRADGIEPGDAVGVLTNASPDMVVAHVAVLLAGATCVPIDPGVGVERVERVVGDASVEVVLVEPETAERAPRGLPRIDLRRVEPAPREQALEPAPLHDPAYVIYTSGSSGNPKGVRVGHRALATSTRARLEVYDSPGPQLLLSSPAFDIWVGALWWALSAGDTIVTLPVQQHADVHWIPRLIERVGVTRFMCMPALYRLVLEAAPPERFASVRMVITGAERVPPDLLTLHARRMPDAPLFNEYGLTETAVWNTVHRCDPATDRAVVPIGRPVPGSRVWVIGEDGRPAPPGRAGELVIGGPCLAEGYQGRPEETARRFGRGPDGDRVYRTGDRARQRPDGALEFIGRVDRQVKIRGQRVELGEIEVTLADHDEVQRCAVVLRRGPGRPTRLQAYVQPRPVPDGPLRAEARAQRVRRWSMIDRAVHGEIGAVEDPTFDISGWNDSFDGTPIPTEQMRRWVEAAVALVAAQRPRRVLELGCGSGLLLFRLAPRCDRYVGCDVAPRVIEGLKAHLATRGELDGRVEVMVADALEAPAHVDGGFDTVVINSVTQHFPDVYYLVDVLDRAIDRLGDAGAVVVGDVRSRPRMAAFHTAVEVHRARADAPVGAVAARVLRAAMLDEELVLDPVFFRDYARRHPRVSAVELRVKPGRDDNEMTRYRFDVVLRVGPGSGEQATPEEPWPGDLDALDRMLAGGTAPLWLLGMPDARTFGPAAAWSMLTDGDHDLADIRSRLSAGGLEPADVIDRARALGFACRVEPCIEGRPDRVDLALAPIGTPLPWRFGPDLLDPWSAMANEPLLAILAAGLQTRLRVFARDRLSKAMVPDDLIVLDALPETVTGKVDYAALPETERRRPEMGVPFAAPRSAAEHIIAKVWAELLELDRVGIDDAVMDLGANSLMLVEASTRLESALGRRVTVVELFEHPTVRSLAAGLDAEVEQAAAPDAVERTGGAVAIIGMALRFPGADDGETFWRNLLDGVESVERFEIRGARVRAGGVIGDVDRFDAAHFGLSPGEAASMDPQQRLFLQCAWAALEDAGRDPRATGDRLAVFAGSGMSTYFVNNVLPGLELDGPSTLLETARQMRLMMGHGPDFVATRVSYLLGGTGPSMTVQTGCSTALVATHLAMRSLRDGECDLAIAGAASIRLPQDAGHVAEEGAVFSPDGRCRPFDAQASGTVFSNGVGAVVLAPLERALERGDPIYAVIRGSAVNNDGPARAGFTAPGVQGQARVIRAALRDAGVDPASVDYVETHGTGTRLGDPIEIEALNRAHDAGARREGPCWLGSVKGNIGHLGVAAGMPGLIKCALALHREALPPTVHFSRPNPLIPWSETPFSVVTESRPWPRGARVRRAGLSAFGMGGTNAHLILEEAPRVAREAAPAESYLLTLGARTPSLLARAAAELADWSSAQADADVSTIAATTRSGRRAGSSRAFAVARTVDELTRGLRRIAAEDPVEAADGAPRIGFVFTGQGSQSVDMGRRLYAVEPVFRDALDRCASILEPHLDIGLLELIHPSDDARDRAEALLGQTACAQPALFSIGWALYATWRHWGIEPVAVMGHSLGTYIAACAAGCLTVEEALPLVALRGRLMQSLPAGGAMASIEAARSRVEPHIGGRRVEIAALNGPQSLVLSGVADDLDAVCADLDALGIATRRLAVSHAFHSALIEPMLDAFEDAARHVEWRPSRIPLVSDTDGAVVDAVAPGPEWWRRHTRAPVDFVGGLDAMRRLGVDTFVELGPHPVLCALGRRHPATRNSRWLPCLRRNTADEATLRAALGALYVAGAEIDWRAVQGERPPQRVHLPPRPLDPKRHWVEPTRSMRPRRAAVIHAFVDARVELEGGGLRYDGRLDPRRWPWLLDHVVDGAPILPGTAMVDLALSIGRNAGCGRIEELLLEAPVPLDAGRVSPLRVDLGAPDAEGCRSMTLTVHGPGGWKQHAHGRLEPDRSRSRPLLPSPPSHAHRVDLEPLYARIERAGVGYGPTFRGLTAARRGAEALHLDVERPDGLALAGFGLHPALLDAALHGLAADESGDALLMPFAWRDVRLFAVEADGLRATLTRDGDRVRLCAGDPAGAAVIEVGELLVRRVAPAGRGALTRVVFEEVDQPEGGREASDAADWAVLGGPDAFAESSDLPCFASLDDLSVAVAAGHRSPRVVIVPQPLVDPPSVSATVAQLDAMARLLRSWLDAPALASSRLVIIDRASPDGDDPCAAAVRGLVRSVRGEVPDRSIALLTLDGLNPPDAVRRAIEADTSEARLSRDRLLRPRWAPLTDRLVPPAAPAWRLAVTPGDLASLALIETDAPLRPLATGEVRLRVRAAGLNFRDVLGALGLYPGDIGPPGSEGAGVVTEVGPGVRDLSVGDRVMGLFEGAFGPVAVAPAAQLCPMPRGWRFAQAASVPAAFLTAWYALVVIGRLRAGERVLIHAAAGGVGMAAAQIARHIGAEVFGTASPGKWSTLRDMGLDPQHIASSRDLDFAGRFPPMQVVLNSLAGDFVDASLALVAPGGRFLEIGRRDRRPSADLPQGFAYLPVDLADAGAERLSRMWRSLLELFDTAALTHLPIRAFDIRCAPDAYRFMQRARHRGKLVFRVPRPLDPTETVVVTGATGGLGRQVVEHLVERHGMRHLLLLSRRGDDWPGAADWLGGLRARGARVDLVSCDVADARAVRAALAEVLADHPVGAVFHLAGVLADGPLARLTRADFERAAGGKLGGALALHAATQHLDLSAFVLFSSAAGTLGTTGQGAYAAANAALDALAERWSRAGHAATALAWAGWDAEGMLAGLDTAQRARLERLGARPIPPGEALALLDRALTRPEAAMLVGDLRRSAHPDAPLLLRRATPPSAGGSSPEAHTMLEQVQSAAMQTLGLSAPPAADEGFVGLGLDSLLSIDLRNALARALGRSIPMSVVLGHDTPATLARALKAGGTHSAQGTAVRLRDGGQGPTLLLLPGIQGELIALHDLVRALPDTARAYGLAPPDLDGRRPCPQTVSALAAAHAESVLGLGALGPVRLIGHSFGAKVGFELARRLLAVGVDVRELVALDGPMWISDRERPAATWSPAEAEAQLAPLLARAAGLDETDDSIGLAATLRALDRPADDADLTLRRFSANMTAAAAYGPDDAVAEGPLDLPVRLIRAESRNPADDFLPDAAASAADPTWGWQAVTRCPVEVEFAPGDHFTLLTGPRAQTLARALISSASPSDASSTSGESR